MFLDLFDRAYGGKSTLTERGVWAGLLLSPMVLAVLRIGDLVAERTPLETPDLLIFAMALAFSIAAGAVLARSALTTRYIGIGVIAIGVIGGVIVVGITIGFGMTIGIGIVIGIVIGIGSGSGRRVVSVIVNTIDTLGVRVSVHPLKAMVSSLAFVGLVNLIMMDAAQTFVDAIEVEGFKVLAFVAFNMFADGVSLLETRWVLQRGAEATIPALLALLVLDLILSAAIFLVLPTILWEVPEFLEAALFRGGRPWLGILFWSTFSTSVLFYLFACAAMLARLSAHVMRVVRITIDVEKAPAQTIAAAAIVEVTAGFAIWAGVSAVMQ